jgi:hypothetical protein
MLKNYVNIKKVLDDPLAGYKLMAGTFKKEKRSKDECNQPCNRVSLRKAAVEQSEHACYSIHQMWGFVQDQERLTMLDSLHS